MAQAPHVGLLLTSLFLRLFPCVCALRVCLLPWHVTQFRRDGRESENTVWGRVLLLHHSAWLPQAPLGPRQVGASHMSASHQSTPSLMKWLCCIQRCSAKANSETSNFKNTWTTQRQCFEVPHKLRPIGPSAVRSFAKSRCA